MESSEEQPMEMSQPATPRSSDDRRRRGRRGGRGRGRGRGPRRPTEAAHAVHPSATPAGSPATAELEIPAQAGREGNSSAIHRAIEEVRQITESLEQVLEQIEEVHEILEVAERQKTADEREIESLRRALRRIHQPRGERPESPVQSD